MVKLSRSGRPIPVDDVAADDALIDALFAAPLHGSVNIDDGAGGELARRLMAVRCRPQDLADGAVAGFLPDPDHSPAGVAGFVEARSCLNRVIATLLVEGPAWQLSGRAGRIPAQRDSRDRDVSAAIADAIEALDIAFETWLAATAAEVTCEPQIGSVADREAGCGYRPDRS